MNKVTVIGLICWMGLAAWPSEGADASLRSVFEQTIYGLKDSGDGSFRGVNRKQRIDLEFGARGVRLRGMDGTSDVGLRFAGYGYGKRLVDPGPANLSAAGNRMEYRRQGITEWYVNESRGLEQGFTLDHRRPSGRPDEPLVIALSVGGGLRPVLDAAGHAVLLQAGNRTVLRYAGLHTKDALGRTVDSRLEVRGREIRLVIEDRDAHYPLVVDPTMTWNQEAELTAPVEAAGDFFGYSVAVSGNLAIVGAHGETVNSNPQQGAAYIFVQSGGTWTQQAELIASDGAAYDYFGFSVALSGNTAVVGAESKTVNSNYYQGAAYIFVQNGGEWSQQAELIAPDGAANDFFGSAVAVDGNTAVVAASSKAAGTAYVFVRTGEAWSQQAELTASDGATNDQFGSSVSVSGNVLAAGSPNKTVNSNSSQGAAYVFVQNGGAWIQQAELTESDGSKYDFFGIAIAVSGNTLAVGAEGKAINSNAGAGAAYIFVSGGATWSQQAELTASDGQPDAYFGSSVAISGSTALIGAPALNVPGSAYVFAQNGTSWSQQVKLTASNQGPGERFGWSASLSGNTAVMGIFPTNSNSEPGAAYVFGEPVPTAAVLSASPNPAVFGSAVTLSAAISPSSASGTVTFYDGTTVLGEAPVVNGAATLNTTLLAAGARSLTARFVGAGGPALSSPYTETVNAQPASGFAPAGGSPFNAGVSPNSIAVGDFNNDGYADLAVANEGSANVTVLLGNGSGGFTQASGSPFAAGPSPGFVATADFNGDGYADLAVVNTSGTVTVLLGNGSGGFAPAAGSPFSVGSNPYAVAIADFNGDGYADLAVVNYGGNNVTVLLGNGSGGFTPASGSPFAAGNGPTALAAGDFNGDGNADLAIANGKSNNVTVLLGDGAGGFLPASGSPFNVGTTPSSVAVADFNGDGNADLAVANGISNNVTVLLGNGSGGFTPANGSPFAANEAVYVAAGDFNGDGNQDLAVVDVAGEIIVLVGNGSGSFTTGITYPVGAVPAAAAVADFNGDGKTDVAVANGNDADVTVLLGVSIGGAAQLQIVQQPSNGTVGSPIGAVQVAVEDANGNLLSGSTAAVTVASNPAGVSGTLTQTAVNGIATFGDLQFGAAGSYTLTASSSGLTSATTTSIQIGRQTQTINFGPLANQTFGSGPITLSATATSGLPVSFTSLTTSVCTVSGDSVTLVALGKCTIRASQPGNSEYAPATPVNQSFQVTKGSQTISFSPIGNVAFSATPVSLVATASSGLPVTFTSLTTGVCTVSGNEATLAGVGTCTIRASQPGNADYAAATPVNQSFQVTRGSQSISFGPLSNQPYNAAPFEVSATASSGLSVNFASTTTSVCTVSGDTVTVAAVGTCTIRASQPGNADYTAAPPVSQSFQVTRASQTISFGALPNEPLSTPPFTVSATASSGLPVSFASATTTICTVSGNEVTLVAVGRCTIHATQPGNVDYAAAAPVNQSFQVTNH